MQTTTIAKDGNLKTGSRLFLHALIVNVMRSH